MHSYGSPHLPDPMNPHRVAAALRQLADAIESDDGEVRAKIVAPPALEPPAEILTREDAAKLLKVHPNQILHLVKQRGLPGKKMGRGWRFRHSEVLAWLGRQGQGAH